MTKIVGWTLTGSYPVPFFDYSLASVYNHLDEIVVVNSGHDFPAYSRNDVPLLEVTEAIKKLDINRKVTEITILDQSKLNGLPDAPETMGNRAIAATLANDKAVELGADWILWWAADQVFFENVRNLKELSEQTSTDGFQFYEYKAYWGAQWFFALDATDPYSNSDGAKFYKARGDHGERQWFKGEGGIMHYRQQTPTELCLTAHVRECIPTEKNQYPEPVPFLTCQIPRRYFYYRDHAKVEGYEETPFLSFQKAVDQSWNVWQRAQPGNLKLADPLPEIFNAKSLEEWISSGEPK